MPSVLVELGYISNRDEERFMKSSDGQNQLASALYDAFNRYKKEYDRKQGGVSGSTPSIASSEVSYVEYEAVGETVPAGSEEDILNKKKNTSVSSQKKQTTAATRTKSNATGKIVYKVQILTSDKKLSPGQKCLKDIRM